MHRKAGVISPIKLPPSRPSQLHVVNTDVDYFVIRRLAAIQPFKIKLATEISSCLVCIEEHITSADIRARLTRHPRMTHLTIVFMD